MLVLSRKVGEQIMIGQDVVITVCRIGGGQVRIGIEAPKELNVIRVEADRSVASPMGSRLRRV